MFMSPAGAPGGALGGGATGADGAADPSMTPRSRERYSLPLVSSVSEVWPRLVSWSSSFARELVRSLLGGKRLCG